jgi:hypothetical protein
MSLMVALCASAPLCLMSCSSAPTSPSTPNLTGTWRVTFTGTGTEVGFPFVQLTQSGNRVTGSDTSWLDAASDATKTGTVTVVGTSKITGTAVGNAVNLTENDTFRYVDTVTRGTVVTYAVKCAYTLVYALTASSSSSLTGTFTGNMSCDLTSSDSGIIPPAQWNEPPEQGGATFTRQ